MRYIRFLLRLLFLAFKYCLITLILPYGTWIRYLAEIDEWEKLFERLDKPPECTPIQKDVSDPEASENPIIKASEKQFGTLVEKLSCEVCLLAPYSS